MVDDRYQAASKYPHPPTHPTRTPHTPGRPPPPRTCIAWHFPQHRGDKATEEARQAALISQHVPHHLQRPPEPRLPRVHLGQAVHARRLRPCRRQWAALLRLQPALEQLCGGCQHGDGQPRNAPRQQRLACSQGRACMQQQWWARRGEEQRCSVYVVRAGGGTAREGQRERGGRRARRLSFSADR